MGVFARYFLLFLLIAGLANCKSKKKSLSGDDIVEISDFIDFFPDTKLPWRFTDTTLRKKEKDSLLINSKVFHQFIPDSILDKLLGKNARPRIYAMAKVKNDDETYLFTKVVSGVKHVALALGFDKKDKFVAALPLLVLDNTSATQQVSGIDSRFTLYKTISRKNTDGTISEGKDVYILNRDAKDFMLIMTDALDDKATELINPIDTLSRKQRFTADYGSGKMNLFSFRDGRRSDRLTFFIHFEKNNGECTGELKGEAIMKTPTQAIYREQGEHCVLQFNFTSGSVTVKEVEACGSRRGLRCSFNGTYPRKKEVKSKKKKTSGK